MYMKKNNNKFRNNNNYNNNSNNNYNNNNSSSNNNTNKYSLTYKFDSSSIAGKFSGTALDLIKKYNELAKEAQSNHDYVSAEIFKQYAEHYRKIVTDINERKSNNVQITAPAPKEQNCVEPVAEAPIVAEAVVSAPVIAPVATTVAPPKKTLRKKLVVVSAK